MSDRIVFFDIETGGLQARPSIMSRQQWDALEKWDRGPKPRFDILIDGVKKGEEWTMNVGGDWCYCPGNPIIQIAAIGCYADSLEPVDEFEVKLKFRPELATAEALDVNSYDAETWERDAVPYPQGIQEFCRYLDRHKTVELISERTGRPYRVAALAGHNAASFDREFIQRSCEDVLWQRYALPGDRPRTSPPKSIFFPGSFQVLDTLHLARWAFADQSLPARPENFRLETLAEFYEIDPGEAHDALSDVRTTIEVAKILKEAIGL